MRYLATIYAKFPNVVFAEGVVRDRDPGRAQGPQDRHAGESGSGWIMLQGLLGSAGLSTDDVDVVLYPDYGQLTGVEAGQVDAATGFANNEPIQLGRTGATPVVLPIDGIVRCRAMG